LRHFAGARPDPHVQADMAPVRPSTWKNVSPASNALAGLVRLLARQAAREWAERRLE
jgi:hypothetical protein